MTLAERVTNASSEFILDRALTTALALPASGAEVAANQWVTADELGLGGDEVVWAGTVVSGGEAPWSWTAGSVASQSRRRAAATSCSCAAGTWSGTAHRHNSSTTVRIRAFPGLDGISIDGEVEGADGGR